MSREWAVVCGTSPRASTTIASVSPFDLAVRAMIPQYVERVLRQLSAYPRTWERMNSGDRFHACAEFVNGYLKPDTL